MKALQGEAQKNRYLLTLWIAKWTHFECALWVQQVGCVFAGIKRDNNGQRWALFPPITVKPPEWDQRTLRESSHKEQIETSRMKCDRRSLRGQQTDEHTIEGAGCDVTIYCPPPHLCDIAEGHLCTYLLVKRSLRIQRETVAILTSSYGSREPLYVHAMKFKCSEKTIW
jgi:hypothetical protein